MLYLALSCLQGRLGSEALKELLLLKPTGIQLTPGNVIDSEFTSLLGRTSISTRTHNGFSWKAMRKRVWEDGVLNGYWDSVHAPTFKDCPNWWLNIQTNSGQPAWEIMYPSKHNYHLSTWAELDNAMNMGIKLAVDISHLAIMRDCYGEFPLTLKRLQDYHNINEIHVSQSIRDKDAHAPITKDTLYLEWAKERLASGTQVVLECYMHKLTQDERLRQIALLQ